MKTENKLNILFINHVSSKKMGGAERVLDNILCRINKKAFSTVLLIQKSDCGDNEDYSDWSCSNNTVIEPYSFGSLSHKSRFLGLLVMLYRIIFSVFSISYIIKKHNIDVVCANSIISAAFSAIPSRIMGRRFFYYEHNIASQRKGHIIGLALKPVSWLATDIICISESVRRGMLAEGVCLSKLHLVHNGYDFELLLASRGKKTNLPSRHQADVFRIGMVANYMPWKRHQMFLEIIDRLSIRLPMIRIQGVLVGGMLPGNEEYFQNICTAVEQYKGVASYEIAGFQDCIADYLESFDVLINPAQAEPFGLIFLEAMALKCVVFGSVDGAAPEIIKDGDTGYVVDYHSLSEVIETLVELAVNMDKRISIGEAASQQVQRQFSIRTQVEQIEGLFRSG